MRNTATNLTSVERLGRFSGTVFSIMCLLLLAGSACAQSTVDTSWAVLRAGFVDKAVGDRAAAVRLLGLLENNPKAAEFALRALADQKSEVRTAAAQALGNMKAKSALPQLRELAKTEEDPAAIMACARALIALGDPLGYNVYYAVLTGERKAGGDLLDAQKKMLSDPKKMAQFGFEQGIGFVPFGGIAYGAFKVVTKDDTSPVRAAAADILAQDPDPKSGIALVTAASDQSWVVRAAALAAISQREDPSLLPRVEPKLKDEKEVVRYAAAAAIIHLYDVKAGNSRAGR